MQSCARRESLALHPSERSDAAKDCRRFELVEQQLLITITTLDVELQTNVPFGFGRTDVLH